MAKLWDRVFVRYVFVGGFSYIIELSSLLVLIHVLHTSLQVSTAAAYWIGLLVAFSLQKLVAFQDYRRELKTISRQGLIFGVLTLWNWFFTVWFVGLFTDNRVILSRTAALVVMVSWNYLIYKHFVFKQPSEKTDEL